MPWTTRSTTRACGHRPTPGTPPWDGRSVPASAGPPPPHRVDHAHRLPRRAGRRLRSVRGHRRPAGGISVVHRDLPDRTRLGVAASHVSAVATRAATVARPDDSRDLRIIAAILFPVWAFNGPRFGAALERMRVLVPEHTVRFVDQLHATEGWHESLGLPAAVESRSVPSPAV